MPFIIPAGTKVLVQRIGGKYDSDWKEHVTREELSFDAIEDEERYKRIYQFRFNRDWRIRVPMRLVKRVF